MIDRSKKQEEKPRIVGRVGQVIYWYGCVLGILSVPAAVSIANAGGQFSFSVFVVVLACGFGIWLIGRAARFILRGD